MTRDTARLQPMRVTRQMLLLKRAFKTGDILDSLKRAFVSAFRLYTSGERGLIGLARTAMLAIRLNAGRVFGSAEIADAFLMGGY